MKKSRKLDSYWLKNKLCLTLNFYKLYFMQQAKNITHLLTNLLGMGQDQMAVKINLLKFKILVFIYTYKLK